MKICSKCKVKKELNSDNFGILNVNSDGYHTQCRSCALERSRNTKAKKPEQYRAARKAYKEKTKERRKEQGKLYSLKNKEKIAKRKREFRIANSALLKARRLEYTSRPEVKEAARQYVKNRIKVNPQFKLTRLLRSRLNNALRSKGIKKHGSAIHDLGCSVFELKLYLESKFESWMNWDNHGMFSKNKDTWNLDHIVPLSKFNLENKEDYLKACHYTNLQPLKALDNLKKNRF